MTTTHVQSLSDRLWVQIIYGEPFESEVLEVLEALELEKFTRWVGVQGQGNHSPPHLDSHVWPGSNQVLGLLMDGDRLESLLSRLRGLKERAPQIGLRALYWPVSEGV